MFSLSIFLQPWLVEKFFVWHINFHLQIPFSTFIFGRPVEGNSTGPSSFPGLYFVSIYPSPQVFPLDFTSRLLAIYWDHPTEPPSIRENFIHHSSLWSAGTNFWRFTSSLDSYSKQSSGNMVCGTGLPRFRKFFCFDKQSGSCMTQIFLSTVAFWVFGFKQSF